MHASPVGVASISMQLTHACIGSGAHQPASVMQILQQQCPTIYFVSSLDDREQIQVKVHTYMRLLPKEK
jgi:hypothetical protein